MSTYTKRKTTEPEIIIAHRAIIYYMYIYLCWMYILHDIIYVNALDNLEMI